MKGEALKDYLIKIAENVDQNTELEDEYNQLALLDDIDESEKQEESGETLTQDEVEKKSRKWLK